MATPEGKVKTKVAAFLKKHNIPSWSIIPSAMGGSTGMSDRCGITKDGRWLAIEVKAEGKRNTVTANQQKFLDTINSCGGRAFVVSCDIDLIEVETNLKLAGVI